MTESIEPDLQDDAGFAIPAQHARKARIRQVRPVRLLYDFLVLSASQAP